jgi:hypothetical protein
MNNNKVEMTKSATYETGVESLIPNSFEKYK